ncbi:MAG: ATP-binding protein [Chloroflexi bacterium]|nr:ATP-binding protein [Chloroflexota bacterium]
MQKSYKVFNSAEFADRNAEFERVQAILQERNRGGVIFEGERGSGKTTLLLELYRRFHGQIELKPFLVSLFPYFAPEFESNKNIWINSERMFQKEDIPDLLNRIARYLEIDFIETEDRDFQKDYFARGLAYRTSKAVPILLVDSIYECPDDIRTELEKYILAPILASERVFIVLSGRGKRPIWSRPELQTAEIIKLHPLLEIFVKEQLEKMKSVRAVQYQQIAELSDGYPLIVRVLGESDKALTDALNDAINIIIQDTLPENEREGKRYLETRSQIEKLSLVDIPFRIPDVEDYLYPNDPKQRAQANQLFNVLLASRILRYEGKGYQLNQSIVHPVRKWLALKQHPEFRNNLDQLKRVSQRLQEEYPSASNWYQRMVPTDLITTRH